MQAISEFKPIFLVDLNTPWERVLDLGKMLTYAPKSIIPSYHIDNFFSGIYYIKKGHVRLSHIAANGQEKVMFYMGHGTLFNEISMLQERTISLLTCIEPTEIIFFPKNRLNEDFIRCHPDLILNLLDSMSFKTITFYTQLGGLQAYDTFTNVCRTLYSMHLFNRVGDKIMPPLTKQELATYLGVHRSSLHRSLFRLQNERIMGTYSRKELEIYDLERLLAYAEGER